jgi:hypothetical protein
MEALFGARKTPAERIKEYNRSIKKCAAIETSFCTAAYAAVSA